MRRLFDVLIIFIMDIFLIIGIVPSNYIVWLIYYTLIVAFLSVFFLNNSIDYKNKLKDKYKLFVTPKSIVNWSNLIMAIACMGLTFYNVKFIIAMPFVIYNMMNMGNVSFVCLAVLIQVINYGNIGNREFWMVLALSFISGIVSVRSEKLDRIEKAYIDMIDDDSIKQEKLKKQNISMLKAKDDEIYMAQLSERNRIAREIHDNVGHMLTRAILQLGALITIHKEEPVHSQLGDLKETLDVAMNNIRESVHDIHDESIDLNSAMKQMAEPLEDKFEVNLDMDIGKNVAREIKYAILGTCKEAISNVIKYSDNDYVDIKLYEHPGMYQLVIHDYSKVDSGMGPGDKQEHEKDGKKDFDYTGTDGIGLENIATRVKNVGGTVNISNDNGFRIFVSIPKTEDRDNGK